jgi:hypothetical protein
MELLFKLLAESLEPLNTFPSSCTRHSEFRMAQDIERKVSPDQIRHAIGRV